MLRIFSYSIIANLCLALNCNAKPLTVYLDWFLNPHHAPLIIAQQNGLFRKHGLEVTLINASGSEEGSKQVAIGNADIAVSKQSSHLIRVINQGMPLVRIATLIDTTLECLITSPRIHKISDLKGKKIGFTSSNIEFATYSINTILKFNGVDPKTVTLVPINSSMISAFLENKVDAIFSVYRTYEVREILQKEPGANIFCYEENGIPSYEQVILITNKKNLLLSELKKFIEALRESCSFIKTHPEEAWASYIKHLPEKDTPLERDIFFQLSTMFVNDPSAFSTGKYEKFAEYLSANSFLKKPLVPVSEYAVDTLNK